MSSDSYSKIINNRLNDLTRQGGLLYKLTKNASKRIYEPAKTISEQSFSTDIVYNSYGSDLSNKANEILFELGQSDSLAQSSLKKNGKGYRYTEVSINNLVITISQVVTPYEMVRDSKFRNNYAQRLNPTLFDPTPKPFSISGDIYAIILHGPTNKSTIPRFSDRSLGFLRLAVVDDAFEDYIYNKCLFDLCSIDQDIPEPSVSHAETEKEQEVEISIKKTS